jgi:hypothetical protein
MLTTCLLSSLTRFLVHEQFYSLSPVNLKIARRRAGHRRQGRPSITRLNNQKCLKGYVQHYTGKSSPNDDFFCNKVRLSGRTKCKTSFLILMDTNISWIDCWYVSRAMMILFHAPLRILYVWMNTIQSSN